MNKWDLVEKDTATAGKFRNEMETRLGPLAFVPILFISVLNKQRIFQVVEKAMEIYENRKRKISTSALNKIMLPLIEKYPPPAVKGKYIKIKYVTQLPTETPAFAFFCNHPQYIQPPYERYLINKIRENFDFSGVPIKVVFRNK